MNLPNGVKSEVRAEAQHLQTLGFEFTGIKANGHLGFDHLALGRLELPYSPSDAKRWRENHRARLARSMGISKRELELRLGIRQEKRQGPKVRRQRNEAGRQHRKVFSGVKPPPQIPWSGACLSR